MKRKAGNETEPGHAAKRKLKPSISSKEAKERFRAGLFDEEVLRDYVSEYARSDPYQHCVINRLINDQLLRNVKSEINSNIVFTRKETDIYRIHQSGDLANLDGLDDESLSKLPSLLKLRDGLYSQSFRDYISTITGCGPLSGQKRDLAINTYTPGSYLICHDDVIGTRKVSYILYLVDPDLPWKAEWGGALRLFPVRELQGKDGVIARTPAPDHTKSIPPVWNQLSFFAVQPNESFHDVEEVYRAATKEQLEKDGGRIRMAISGWFHIPQLGEDGYVKGAAEALEANSGLAQLQGNPDQYDMPQANVVEVKALDDAEEFNEKDLDFLVKYLAPQYLTPDAVSGIRDRFIQDSCIALPDFLHPRFAEKLRDYAIAQEAITLPASSEEIEKGAWKIAKPPHKHRYMYMQTGKNKGLVNESPITELMDVLLPSPQFRKWLKMIADTSILSHEIIARRFRRGMDYTLATGHEDKPRLELNLGFTPTSGWKDDGLDLEDDEEDNADSEADGELEVGKAADKVELKDQAKGKDRETNGKSVATNGGENKRERSQEKEEAEEEAGDESEDEDDGDFGGHEIYMATDDNEEDAAVYKAADDEDSVLFGQAPAFNRLTLVLRDQGILRFVKYVSRSAQGDRWDVSATYELDGVVGEDDESDGKNEEGSSEEEFQGFSNHEDDESD